jgi:hypothetical protein
MTLITDLEHTAVDHLIGRPTVNTERFNALLVRAETDDTCSSYFHVRAQPCRIVDESPHGVSDDPLNDLEIHAQANPRDALYAWRVVFRQPYSVDLRRAEAMVKALRTIDHQLTKLSERFGWPESFSAWFARVADSLGISRFLVVANTGARGQVTEWRELDLSAVQSWIASREREYQEKHTAEAAS